MNVSLQLQINIIDMIFSNPLILVAMIGAIAVFAYIMANIMMRKINTRIIYHKSGGTVEILKCRETEERVIFRTRPDAITKKQAEITITKVGTPEVQVSGMNTFRMFHAVEGYGHTVEIRDIAKDQPTRTGSPVATSLAAMASAFELINKSLGKSKTEWTMLAIGFACAFLAGLGWGGFVL